MEGIFGGHLDHSRLIWTRYIFKKMQNITNSNLSGGNFITRLDQDLDLDSENRVDLDLVLPSFLSLNLNLVFGFYQV